MKDVIVDPIPNLCHDHGAVLQSTPVAVQQLWESIEPNTHLDRAQQATGFQARTCSPHQSSILHRPISNVTILPFVSLL